MTEKELPTSNLRSLLKRAAETLRLRDAKPWDEARMADEIDAFLQSPDETDGYSQGYADKMRTTLLCIQGIAMAPGQEGNRETQMRNIACLASDGLLGVDRGEFIGGTDRGS